MGLREDASTRQINMLIRKRRWSFLFILLTEVLGRPHVQIHVKVFL